MTTPTSSRLHKAKTFLMLWGYGWKRRKRPAANSYRIEWQDPMTGSWYGDRAALRLLKAHALALYDRQDSAGGPCSRRF
ncbi:MAG: hypothetical protein PHT19_03485 [Methylococcus sp.]|nr:hypothetical protein [Methylococcus sp.]